MRIFVDNFWGSLLNLAIFMGCFYQNWTILWKFIIGNFSGWSVRPGIFFWVWGLAYVYVHKLRVHPPPPPPGAELGLSHMWPLRGSNPHQGCVSVSCIPIKFWENILLILANITKICIEISSLGLSVSQIRIRTVYC